MSASPAFVWSTLDLHAALEERRAIRKACRFCQRRNAKALCDWPVERARPVKVEELQNGDHVLSELARRRCRVIAPQEFVRTDRPTGYWMYWLEFPGRGKISDLELSKETRTCVGENQSSRVFQYLKPKGFVLQTFRPATCDAPCCFACRRHVGPGRDYCREHWCSWETAGPGLSL